MRNTESVDHEEHRVCGSGGGCVDRQSEEPEGIIPEQVRLMGEMHIRAEVPVHEYDSASTQLCGIKIKECSRGKRVKIRQQ